MSLIPWAILPMGTYNKNSMAIFFRINFLLTFLIGALCSCTPTDNEHFEVPEYISDMNNVVIFSPKDIENADTIRLIKDQEFGDSDDLFFANVRGFITDDSGRLYIWDIAPGTLTIHLFSSNGDYITSLGRKGRGPGEFNSICCLNVRSNDLHVVDQSLSRVTVYSTDSLDLLETVSIDQSSLNSAAQIEGKRLLNHYF